MSSIHYLEGTNILLVDKSKIDSSSITLCGNSSMPFSLVYGSCSGDIKPIELEYSGPNIYAKEDGLQ